MNKEKRILSKKRLFGMVLALFLFFGTGIGFADDPATADDTPAFANPAQAQRAENVSSAYYGQLSKEEQEEVDAALAALEDSDNTNDEDAITTLSSYWGVRSQDLASMRDDGMGWGQIAHELGVHPSALGLGHTKGKDMSSGKGKSGDDEMAEAVSRNLQTGWSKEHGFTSVKTSGKGLGLSSDKSQGKAKAGAGPGSAGGKGKDGADGGPGSGGKGSAHGNGGSGKGK